MSLGRKELHKVNPDLYSKGRGFSFASETTTNRNIFAFSKYATDSSLAVMGSF